MILKSKQARRYNEIIPVLVWTFVFVLPFLLRIILFRSDPRNESLLNIFCSFLTIIGIFYIHTYLVYPFVKKKNGKWIYGALLLICLIIFLLSMNFFMRDLSGVAEAHGLPNLPGKLNPARIALILPFAVVIFCSYSYRIYIEKIKQNELIKEMETNHLKTELDFLRSQVSPHFMFNLMNTLVSMARKKSDLMEPSLVTLSQFMRYMLYDSSNEKINLTSEIEYLKNYINLQLLRFGDSVRSNLFISGAAENFKIEPMLLIPFVENAFKHGTDNVEDPMIEVSITIDGGKGVLDMMVINSVTTTPKRKNLDSGIGLANVHRRLALLYPNRHRIDVEEKEGLYTVNLKVNL